MSNYTHSHLVTLKLVTYPTPSTRAENNQSNFLKCFAYIYFPRGKIIHAQGKLDKSNKVSHIWGNTFHAKYRLFSW
jgi:hypothetical protein